MASVHEARANTMLKRLWETHPGAQLLVNDSWSIYYLTGFYADLFERFSGVLLREGEQPVIFMNALHAMDAYDNARVVMYDDTDDLFSLLAAYLDPARELGVEDSMRSGFLLGLQQRHAAAGYFSGTYAIAGARARKDAREQELMRSSSAINDEVMSLLPGLLHTGVTEREVAAQILSLYRQRGCSGFSFEPIVSFGANAADPHHMPDDTQLREDMVVLFDIGGRYQGYCSDMTRTYFWGAGDEEARRIHDIVRRANEAAEALVAPGVRFCDIDRAAREVIEQAGYGAQFTHRLGHSIGLQDHEPGDVSAVNEDAVEPGMTFSIEPGIYLPGHAGVRIEDLVLVTEDGCEVLNKLDRCAHHLSPHAF